MSLDPSRYADLFRTESREQLSAINRALLLVEGGGDPAGPVGGRVPRRAHHEGDERDDGVHAVAEFAHELEYVLDRVRSGDQPLGPALMDASSPPPTRWKRRSRAHRSRPRRTPAMAAALRRLADVPVAPGRRAAGRAARRAAGAARRSGAPPAA